MAQAVNQTDLENNDLIPCPSNWESFPVLAGGMGENSAVCGSGLLELAPLHTLTAGHKELSRQPQPSLAWNFCLP